MRALAVAVVLAACGSKPAPSAPETDLSNKASAPPQEPPQVAGLALFGVEPDRGDELGGTYCVVRGHGFLSAGPRNAKVYFGSRQGNVVRFASDEELIVEAPGGTSGEIVDVLVIFEPGGEHRLRRAFRYVTKGP